MIMVNALYSYAILDLNPAFHLYRFGECLGRLGLSLQFKRIHLRLMVLGAVGAFSSMFSCLALKHPSFL